MPDHSDNIFDDDDALDYIIYKSLKEEAPEYPEHNKGQGGCLGLLLLIAVPIGMFGLSAYCFVESHTIRGL